MDNPKNSFRNRTSSFRKIEDTQSERDIKKGLQDINGTLKTGNPSSSSGSKELAIAMENLAKAVADAETGLEPVGNSSTKIQDNQLAASELVLDEVVDIKNILKDKTNSISTTSLNPVEISSDSSESSSSDLAETGFVSESIDELLKVLAELKTGTETETEIKEALDEIVEELKVISPTFTAPSLPLQPELPVPTTEPILVKTVPDKADLNDKKSRSLVLTDLMSGVKSMVASLSSLVFQATLQGLKMAGVFVAGIFAIELLIAVVKNIWDKFGPQIKEGLKWIGEKYDSFKSTLENIWSSGPIQEIVTAIVQLSKDLLSGEFLHGFSNYLGTIFTQFQDGLSLLTETILRAIPGFSGTADKVSISRTEDKINRGQMPTAEELVIYNEKQSSSIETKEQQKTAKILQYAAEKNTRLEFKGLSVDKNAEVYKNVQKEVELLYPEFNPMPERDIQSEVKINALSHALSRSSETFTEGDLYRIQKERSEISNVAPQYNQRLQDLDTMIVSRTKNTVNNELPKAQKQETTEILPEKKPTIQNSSTGGNAVVAVNTTNNNQSVIAPPMVQLPGMSIR